MKNLLDWSRPRTWVLFGLLIAVLGSIIMSAQDEEGGGGRVVLIAGVALMVIGGVAYISVQVLKAVEASKRD